MSANGWKVGDCRSIVHQFTADEVKAFAALTGDSNPLHVDSDFARKTPAGGKVVHGMLAASLISTLIGTELPGPGALWQSFQVNWRKMIRIGEPVQFEVKVIETHPAVNMLVLAVMGRSMKNREILLEGRAAVLTMSQKNEEKKTDLKGKRFLVTGAAGEVGSAICRRLAEQGAKLILWGRNEARLSALAESLPCVDGKQSVDLADSKAVESNLKKIEQDGVYGVVYAAAPEIAFVSVDHPENQNELEKHWNVSVGAFNRIVQAAIPSMKEGGSIVHILTQFVFDAPPAKQAAYVSAKAAAWALIRSMALELGPRGIRCNAISPGMMNTPYSKDTPVRIKQAEEAGNPLRRLCAVEDVADAVAFLSGPQARFINGINLPVTGGARMP